MRTRRKLLRISTRCRLVTKCVILILGNNETKDTTWNLDIMFTFTLQSSVLGLYTLPKLGGFNMKYLTPHDLAKIAHKKGKVLKSGDRINMVERDATELGQGLKVYTVWNYEENFIFVHTTDFTEAEKTFNKYVF